MQATHPPAVMRYCERRGRSQDTTGSPPVPGERFELPTNGLQNRCSTTELTRLATGSGPLSTAAGVSEYRFARAAIVSQIGVPRRAARTALHGPSETFAAPRLRGRRVQTPFRAQS